MNKWIDIVLKYPRSMIAFALLITLLMGWNIPKLELEADVKAMLPDDFDIVLSMDEMEDLFGGSELIIMSISSDDVFSNRTLKKIREMTAAVENFPFVDKVVSLTNAVDVKGTEFGFEVGEIIVEFPNTDQEVEQIKDQIRSNELLYGNIVSKDFKSAALIAMLAVSDKSDDDEIIYQAFDKLRQRYENPECIYLAGLPMTRREVAVTMQQDLKTLFPYGIILMIFFLVFSFRSWIGAFLPFVVTIMIVTNTLGFMALLGMKFTFIGLMVPVMLIAVTSSYSIHIISHYFGECARCPDNVAKDSIIRSTLLLLRTPVFLSGLTTLIGFLSLQSHILPPARELGILISFGIGAAFIFSMTFLPAALKVLDYPTHLRKGKPSRILDLALSKWGKYFIRRKTGFLIIIGVIIIGISTGIRKMNVDTNPIYFWDKDSEIRKSNDFIDHYFGGSSQLSILANGDIKSPEFLRKMETLSDYLTAKEQITQVISIVDQLKLMNKAFHSDSIEFKKIPGNREIVAQYLFLYSLTGDPEDLDRFVDYDYRQAQLQARVTELGSAASYHLYLDIKNFIDATFNADEFPSVTGMTAFVGVLADMVVRGQIRSLLISIGLVCLVTAIIFKSMIAGILSIIPLSGAIIIVFGLMGYLGISLDMATVMLSSIMIGVGIDYSIHFLYRFRLEIQNGQSLESAVPETLRTSGKGILYNGISVIIGFSVLLVSGFLPIYFFGFLIVFSIMACLLGALTVMPSILLMIKPAFIYGKKRSPHENLDG